MPYAKALTDLGYVSLCIDSWVFGERSHATEADTFKAMLWQGQVLWGMMVYDSLRALDFLIERPDVDPQRVATLGMSMGSTMAWWVAALDERDQGHGRHQLPDRLSVAPRQKALSLPRPLLLRARPAEALHDRPDQRADRPSRASRARGPAGQIDARRGTRQDRRASFSRCMRPRAIPSAGSCCATRSRTWRPRRDARRSFSSCGAFCDRRVPLARRRTARGRRRDLAAAASRIHAAELGPALPLRRHRVRAHHATDSARRAHPDCRDDRHAAPPVHRPGRAVGLRQRHRVADRRRVPVRARLRADPARRAHRLHDRRTSRPQPAAARLLDRPGGSRRWRR